METMKPIVRATVQLIIAAPVLFVAYVACVVVAAW